MQLLSTPTGGSHWTNKCQRVPKMIFGTLSDLQLKERHKGRNSSVTDKHSFHIWLLNRNLNCLQQLPCRNLRLVGQNCALHDRSMCTVLACEPEISTRRLLETFWISVCNPKIKTVTNACQSRMSCPICLSVSCRSIRSEIPSQGRGDTHLSSESHESVWTATAGHLGTLCPYFR